MGPQGARAPPGCRNRQGLGGPPAAGRARAARRGTVRRRRPHGPRRVPGAAARSPAAPRLGSRGARRRGLRGEPARDRRRGGSGRRGHGGRAGHPPRRWTAGADAVLGAAAHHGASRRGSRHGARGAVRCWSIQNEDSDIRCDLRRGLVADRDRPRPGAGNVGAGGRGDSPGAAAARTATSLPSESDARIAFMRLWPIGAFAIVCGVAGVVFPQVAAIGAGYAILIALLWRRREDAVRAIEDRDGVRFYVEPTSAFEPIRLVRTPGLYRDRVAAAEATASTRRSDADGRLRGTSEGEPRADRGGQRRERHAITSAARGPSAPESRPVIGPADRRRARGRRSSRGPSPGRACAARRELQRGVDARGEGDAGGAERHQRERREASASGRRPRAVRTRRTPTAAPTRSCSPDLRRGAGHERARHRAGAHRDRRAPSRRLRRRRRSRRARSGRRTWKLKPSVPTTAIIPSGIASSGVRRHVAEGRADRAGLARRQLRRRELARCPASGARGSSRRTRAR